MREEMNVVGRKSSASNVLEPQIEKDKKVLRMVYDMIT